METAVVVSLTGLPIYWHLPEGRTTGSLPDSRGLWELLWNSRDTVQGVAHSHPGLGTPYPSYEDVTTFSAIEIAIGRRLTWWITSSDELVSVTWLGPGKYDYKVVSLQDTYSEWLPELRRLSV